MKTKNTLELEIRELKQLLKRKNAINAKSDAVDIVVEIPDATYLNIKLFAKDDYRSVANELVYLAEIGMQVLQQQAEQNANDADEEPELEPLIGFKVDNNDDDDEYEDE